MIRFCHKMQPEIRDRGTHPHDRGTHRRNRGNDRRDRVIHVADCLSALYPSANSAGPRHDDWRVDALLTVIQHMAARLSKADREELERLVALRPGNEGKVVSMRAEARGIARIMTGIRSGPRSGIGRVLRATKCEDGWRIEEVGAWRS